MLMVFVALLFVMVYCVSFCSVVFVLGLLVLCCIFLTVSIDYNYV